MIFFLVYLLIVIPCLVAIFSVPLWGDRAIVWIMRELHIQAYPYASRLAISLERDRGEWRFNDRSHAEHQRIGQIRNLNRATTLYVLVKSDNDTLDWQPDWIERRIICNAARAAYAHVLHAQLNKVLP